MKTEKSDFVLLVNGNDSNISTLEKAIKGEAEGEQLMQDLQRAVDFISTTNISAMVIITNPRKDEKRTEEDRESSLESVIRDIIYELGITPKYHGYYNLKDAIMLVIQSQKKTFQATKDIYPGLAKKYHTTIEGIERNIRTVIGIAWHASSDEAKRKYFKNTSLPRPTNSEFIATLAEYVRFHC